jgi:predicted lipid carrier protein YhbT
MPLHVEQARHRLQVIAESKDADTLEASRVLAMKGDENSILRVEKRLGAPDSGERIAVARMMLRLKRWGAVARALTDDHPAVRLATACNVLSG